MLRTVLVAVSLAASFGLSATAYATHWTVCNRTPENLNVAVGFIDNNNQTATEGWHALNRCGGCAVVLNFDRTQKENVWLFAKNENNVPRFHSAHPRLCVFDQAFRHQTLGGVPCGAGGRPEGFDTLSFPDQSVNHTTNLEGTVAGQGCID
jgi:uncharacterized membrane protein